ncbi:MAG: TetR/AcrR family transcriptional regulator [Pigmentiphaga sp.]|nr:TetR/AcrR family transcriptional regulator [Pigmentiphaga sp.]
MSKPAPPSTSPRSRDASRNSLTPESWINAATGLLVDQGIDAVRVDVIAKRLGVTRGSFYWHFRDRDDLLLRVLKAWRDAATDQLIDRFERRHIDPEILIDDLMTLPFRGRSAREAARIELAIRTWARRDEIVRQALDDVDARRVAYVAQCFSALGFSIAEARARGFALYAWQVGESMLIRQDSDEQKRERKALLQQLLLTPLPQDKERLATS